MLTFRKINLEDKQPAERCLQQIETHLCLHCFVDLYIWRDHYDTEICFQDGWMFIRCKSFPEKTQYYLAPIGTGDLRAAVSTIQEDARERSIPFYMLGISEEMLPRYQETFGNAFTYDWSEDSAEYIYLSEKLQTLSGKKLQSKRNLVNRFLGAYEGRWEYVPITAENVEDAYAFHLDWCQLNGCQNNDSFTGETCAIRIALNHFDALDLRGGMIRLDGQVIAFTLGCQAREDLFVVQIEKADQRIQGAYQMINQQFVRHNCLHVQYVNREEDLGLEGLRKAKRSYYPVMYGRSYMALPVKE